MNRAEVVMEASRPIEIESEALASGTIQNLRDSTRYWQYFQWWNEQRDRFKQQLGAAYDWIGWGPWRVTIIINAGKPSVLFVDAGNLALFGKRLILSAGFQPADYVAGRQAFQKDEMVYVRVGKTWVIGEREAAAQAISDFISAQKNASKLPFKSTEKAGMVVAISPALFKKLFFPVSAPETQEALKQWLDLDDLSGLLASADFHDDRITFKGWVEMNTEKPLVKLWKHLDKGSSSVSFMHPQMTFAARLALKNPADFWEKAKDIYSNRPIPSEFLLRIETELKRELNLDISKLLIPLDDEVGFVDVANKDRVDSILFAGINSDGEKAMREIESGIEGKWESKLDSLNMRYMPRLLAYALQDNRLLIGAATSTLAAYGKGAQDSSGIAREAKIFAKEISSNPLIAVGRCCGAGAVASESNWFAGGVDCANGVFEAAFLIPMNHHQKLKMPWKPRLLGWSISLFKTLGWIFSAFLFIVFLTNALSLHSKRSL